jgi:ATP-binding cassette, subfamily B, bacterial
MLRIGGWIRLRARDASMGFLRPLWRKRRHTYGRSFIGYALVTVLTGSGALISGLLHLSAVGTMTPGALAVLLQGVIAAVLFGTLFPESDVFMRFGLIAWDAVRRVEDALRAPERAHRSTAQTTAPAHLQLVDVRFGYGDGQRVLDGLSLDIPAGSSVAIVGVNGAGKTTLVKILAGFYAPTAGAVEVDGVALRDVDRHAWQNDVAIVFQDHQRYELTIMQNVIMQGRAGPEDASAVASALRRVGLSDFVDGLPLGVHTPLSRSLPGGTELSGGQWQRVALARALYAVATGARVLILDEPTAQMDARGEAEFYDEFLQLTAGVTTILISHRFSSVRRADDIVVLSAARFTEQGSHDDLIAAGGTYAQMFTAQADRFTS